MLDWILVLALAQEPVKKWEWECVRWTWTGDVFNRTVICLEWRKKDCSQRLHEYLCRSGG